MKNFSLISLILFLLSGCFAAKEPVPVKKTRPAQTSETSLELPATDSRTETAGLPAPVPEKASPSKLPKLINHPRPNIEVDLTPFIEASGCQLGKKGEELQGCENLRAKMGCDKFMPPDPLWGAVTPAYPMVLCVILPDSRQYPNSPQLASQLSQKFLEEIEKEGYFTWGQGNKRRYTRYVILRDGQFQLINNMSELQKLFAPIESPEEALSYAMMATQFSAHYGQKINPSYRYYTEVIEDSHVVATKQGFKILLYTHKTYGCGSHPASTLLVTLRLNGMISYPSQRLAYANPAEDNLCMD